ncbi:membrane protein FxsA [Viridibacillus sp. YIM B01967]|uniref:Membrane protein FxsA n=1 Tax=Viridibacillus soli TaxID=2798301 RepID=A0ABS1H2E2_9BACL|nr:FxsA family protein [Viridibacillus soli]MBK3493576.1 membrane protein FxsA [Viridibacillus soli]
MRKILLFLILIPIIEIAVVLLSGKLIGTIPTLILIIVTGVLGVYLAKTQGIKAFRDIQQALQNGQPPGEAVINGLLIFIGGVFLVLPGFVSDIIGLLLIISPTRKLFKPLLYFWMRKKMKNGQVILIQK